MNVTATEAKNRLGQVLDCAQTEPVFIEKAGRVHSVVLSLGRYESLLRAGAADAILSAEQFSARYGAWIEEQNGRVGKLGIWNEELRRW